MQVFCFVWVKGTTTDYYWLLTTTPPTTPALPTPTPTPTSCCCCPTAASAIASATASPTPATATATDSLCYSCYSCCSWSPAYPATPVMCATHTSPIKAKAVTQRSCYTKTCPRRHAASIHTGQGSFYTQQTFIHKTHYAQKLWLWAMAGGLAEGNYIKNHSYSLQLFYPCSLFELIWTWTGNTWWWCYYALSSLYILNFTCISKKIRFMDLSSLLLEICFLIHSTSRSSHSPVFLFRNFIWSWWGWRNGCQKASNV